MEHLINSSQNEQETLGSALSVSFWRKLDESDLPPSVHLGATTNAQNYFKP